MNTDSESSAHNASQTLALRPCQLYCRDECRLPLTCQESPWQFLMDLVRRTDLNMHKHKSEELDRNFRYGILMLTFNGTILADSYKWVTNYASYSFIAQLCAARQPPEDSALFIPQHAATAIVVLWAASFLLISASLMMCHLSRQWLQEFVNQPQFSYKNQLAFRQIHYDSLRRWHFFHFCDIIPVLLPLSTTFFIAGLIVFLLQLNHPDAYALLVVSCVLFLYYTIIAVHPLYCFWKAPRDGLTSELSPFRSPSSWLFFKISMNFTSYFTQRKIVSSKHRKTLLPVHSQFRPPVRTKSIDWLEQNCSLFIQGDNASDIDAPLANALIWVDSNPTIEKTTKVVVAVYHCISDLHLPSILPRFRERWTGFESGLAGIITNASRACTDVNDPAVTAFVLKSWLELHITRLPELKTQLRELQGHCTNKHGKGMPDYACLGIYSIDAFLNPGHCLPEKKVHLLLVTARIGLENNIYYEGTFDLILQVIFQFRDSASEQQVGLVGAILEECKHFAHSFQGSGLDEQQARQFMSELGNFLSGIQAIDCDFDLTPSGHQSWSPRGSDTWQKTITTANEVYFIANSSLPAFLYTHPASPTEPVDPLDDGAWLVSEPFESMQFETNGAVAMFQSSSTLDGLEF